MKNRKVNIRTLEDVRNWRSLKKDELDLEKLKFDAEKNHYKQEFSKGFGKVLLMQGALIAGEKILMSLLKSVFKPKKKKEAETEIEIDPENDPNLGI